MGTSYFKNIISKFLSYFDRSKKKTSSKVNKIYPDTKEENTDDMYSLWWIINTRKIISLLKNIIKHQLFNIRRGFFTLFSLFIFAPLLITIFFVWPLFLEKFSSSGYFDMFSFKALAIMIIYFVISLSFLILTEISFRFLYFLIKRERYIPQKRAKAKNL